MYCSVVCYRVVCRSAGLCRGQSVTGVYNFVQEIFIPHWGRMTHTCTSELVTIGSDQGLSSAPRQSTTWTNADALSIGPLGTKFNEILIEILMFHWRKWISKCLQNGNNFVSASKLITVHSRKRTHKEAFSEILAICEGNPLVPLWVRAPSWFVVDGCWLFSFTGEIVWSPLCEWRNSKELRHWHRGNHTISLVRVIPWPVVRLTWIPGH